MWRFLPFGLILFRLILGPILLMAALLGVSGGWLAFGLTLGFISDIMDGVVARRLNIAHAKLRVWDSYVDGIFCGFVLVCVWVRYPDVVRTFQTPLLVMLGLQGISLMLDWWKYRRFCSYHAYSSKAAGAAQFLAVMGLFAFGVSGGLWWFAIGVTILNNLECMGMTFILPTWTHDVPTLFHAWKRSRQVVNFFSERSSNSQVYPHPLIPSPFSARRPAMGKRSAAE